MSAGSEIGVVVAAFKARNTVARAVRSALAQPEVSEVVVVDDASRDGTADAARAAEDGTGRLRVVELPANGGPSRARNRALDGLKAPFFCVLDADDFLLPGRFERLLASAPRDWDLIGDDIIMVPEQNRDAEIVLPRQGNGPAMQLDLVTFIEGNTPLPRRPRGELGFLKPVIRREFMVSHGLRYDETLRLGEDYALYARALALGARFHVVGPCGYVAVKRDDSLSTRHATSDLEQLVRFDERCLAALPGLSTEERAAFASHRRVTMRRYQYRALLDCKRDRGLLRALAMLARNPEAVPYVLTETVKARLSRLGWDVYGDAEVAKGPRLLIGATPAGLSQKSTSL